MKKAVKWTISILLIVAIVAAIVVTAAITLTKEKDIVTTEEMYREIAQEVERFSYDEETGLLFVNNEIVVVAAEGTDARAMERLADRYDAEIADKMEDVGIYNFKFASQMEADEIDDIAEELSNETGVEDAYLVPVVACETDDEVYPNDPWNGADWDVDNPEGENWGTEAINAPGAWEYMDELQEVNVGLIDTYVRTDHEDLETTALFTSIDTESGYSSTKAMNVSADKAGDHGCHVAGTMGATWDNGKGISGILGTKGNIYSSNTIRYETRNNKTITQYYSAYEYVKAIKALVNKDVRAINISQNTGRLLGFAASRGNKKALDYLERQASLAGNMLGRIITDIEENGGTDFVICISAGNSNDTYYYEDDSSMYGFTEKRGLRFWMNEYKGNSEAKYNNFLSLIEDEKVKNRIIVVGSVQLNTDSASSEYRKYVESPFSCVGERVDVMAPGVNVYSLTANGYDLKSGTSMAAPHVTAVAGLAFAANPSLSGPEVKIIVTSLTNGRYYHGDDFFSGMVDAKKVVEYALKTNTGEAAPISNTTSGLDLCFIVDTTGSMGDDIENAKENMVDILGKLSEKTPDYRVALVDYRDFPERAGYSDYPSKVQLNFSSDNDAIVDAINALSLGSGGDWKETVYSGIHSALGLDWRPRSQKIIIILGDAPPLDPEPVTGYTYDDVIEALFNADIGIDLESSDSRVLGDPDDSAMCVYSIGIGGDDEGFFEKIATDTGGVYTEVESAEEVSDAIIGSIEKIEIESFDVTVSFGEEFSGETVDIYNEDGYMFSHSLDDSGNFVLGAMPEGDYDWKIARLGKSGQITIETEEDHVDAEATGSEWYSFALVVWYRHRVALISVTAGIIVLLILIFVIISKVKKAIRKKREKAKKLCCVCGAEMMKDQRFCDKCGSDNDAGSGVEEAPVQEQVIQENYNVAPEAETAPMEEYLAGVESETVSEPEAPAEEPINEVVEVPVQEQPQAAPQANNFNQEFMFCSNCGQKLPAGSVFCANCGQKVR